ncbi:hypothetical protein RR46_08017 [Papilio xuthus]|uniref:Uncharacterized protein n=1 Tax=Papilio xuthus TaxID=66420 RepID=A0A194QB49_PAPXU|nr:hypothetical protein RR46_08017 [Papilio xuthus]
MAHGHWTQQRASRRGGGAHLSLTGGGMLNAGNSFALGLSNSIAIVFSPCTHRVPVHSVWRLAEHCRRVAGRRGAPLAPDVTA